MKRRALAALTAVVMLFSSLAAAAGAAGYSVDTEGLVGTALKDSQKGVYAGDNFKSMDVLTLNDPLGLSPDPDDPASDFSYWHFVAPQSKPAAARITFETTDGVPVTWEVFPSTADDQHPEHYAVITPSGWKLLDGVSYAPTAANNFNLSHSGRHEAQLGSVTVTASAAPWRLETTPHAYYDRAVDLYYVRPVYHTYQRPVSDVFQRPAQRYLVPVFERVLAGAHDGTLVTRLTYSGSDAKAAPVNGGAFKNGHTYVALDVAAASREGGVWFPIADSSKTNGKKTPDQYNRPVGYDYNVQIADGMLTVSCGDDLAYASVGAFVYASAPRDAKSAPAHESGSVTLPLPEGCGDTVWLYVHFERLGWYAADGDGRPVYRFAGWQPDDSRTEIGDYEVVDTVAGDYALAGISYGWYGPARTVYGAYELAREEAVTERADLPYTGELVLTVDGAELPLDEAFELAPGPHTFTVSDREGAFPPVSRPVEIRPGGNTVAFDPIAWQEEGVTLDAVRHEADRPAGEHYADAEAPILLHADVAGEPIYNEELLYREDIRLGSELDPFGPFAVRR